MPVYVYECEVCGKRFEEHRHYGSPHPTTCPDGHEPIHRVFSPPNIIFRGSGFYVTDHARSNGRAEKSASKDKDEPKSEKKESKVEAKKGEET